MIRITHTGLQTRITQKNMAGISVSKICVPFSGGGVDWSAYWTTRTPTALILTALSDTSIKLDWTNGAVEDYDGLRIYSSTDGVTFAEVDTVAANVETYTATGLTLLTTYYFYVVAYMGTNESTATDTESAETVVSLNFADYEDGAIPVLTGATWAVASDKAVNTPTTTEVITDGGMENWNSATDLTSWTENNAGTSTTNREDTIIRGGTYSARMDVDATPSRADFLQTPTISMGDFFNIFAYARQSSANKNIIIRSNNQIAESLYGYNLPTADWAQIMRSCVRSVSAGFSISFRNLSAASTSYYVDDVSCLVLTKTTLFANINTAKSDVQVKAYWNGVTNMWRGVIMNLDSVVNPQNYVLFVTNGLPNNTYLIKCVNGTVSQVVSSATTGDANSQLIELRKSGNTYKQFIGGVQLGADQTISDASIVGNTIHGLFSTYSANTCDYFSCSVGGDIVSIPDGATIPNYYKYVSSGDTVSLAVNGTYTFGAGVSGFSTLPSGAATGYTTINGNNSTITGGNYGVILTSKNYINFNDIEFIDQAVTGFALINCNYINRSNILVHSTDIGAGYIDAFKIRGCTHINVNDCVAGPCVGAASTCDGFEDWDCEDVEYNDCVAHGFQNGAEDLNNGHGFETYAQEVGEICRRITYNNCHAYDCRVGFSCEGGVLSAAHEDVVANDCTTATIDLYDASGVDGATLYVTAGTLTSRNGNVTEI